MSMNSFHARSSRPAAKAEKQVVPTLRKGVRADVRLVELGLAASRSEARRLIEAGRVAGPGGPVSKAALELPAETPLRLI